MLITNRKELVVCASRILEIQKTAVTCPSDFTPVRPVRDSASPTVRAVTDRQSMQSFVPSQSLFSGLLKVQRRFVQLKCRRTEKLISSSHLIIDYYRKLLT